MGILTIIKIELRARVGCNTEASNFAVCASMSAHAIPGVATATAETKRAVFAHVKPLPFVPLRPPTTSPDVAFRISTDVGRTPILRVFCAPSARETPPPPPSRLLASFWIPCGRVETRIFACDTRILTPNRRGDQDDSSSFTDISKTSRLTYRYLVEISILGAWGQTPAFDRHVLFKRSGLDP